MLPKPKHQKISGRICTAFLDFLKQNPIGEVIRGVDVYLGNEIVIPDVLFIAKERLNIIGELNVQGAPDLVVEVLSPSTARYDRKEKRQLYFANGVKEYWLIDPDQQLVEILIAGEKEWQWIGIFDREDVLTTALLPGLEINLNNIFETKGDNGMLEPQLKGQEINAEQHYEYTPEKLELFNGVLTGDIECAKKLLNLLVYNLGVKEVAAMVSFDVWKEAMQYAKKE